MKHAMEPLRTDKLDRAWSGPLVPALVCAAVTLPIACRGIEDSVGGRHMAGGVGILIGVLILLRAFKEAAVLKSRAYLYGRYFKAGSAVAGGVAILCYDGELSPCFTIALLLSILLLVPSFVLRLRGLAQLARSETESKKIDPE